MVPLCIYFADWLFSLHSKHHGLCPNNNLIKEPQWFGIDSIMYYLCTYKLIVYSNYYRRKGRSSYSCLFYVLTVYDCIHTVSRAGSHGSKRFLSNRVMAVRRLLMTQKTVYDLKLLVIFLKKSVMFFKKLVMFYQSLADDCCSLLY